MSNEARVEMSLADIETILVSDDNSTTPIDTFLRERLVRERGYLKELDDMEFDDCASGACKL